jgi:hypothetical protein
VLSSSKANPSITALPKTNIVPDTSQIDNLKINESSFAPLRNQIIGWLVLLAGRWPGI